MASLRENLKEYVVNSVEGLADHSRKSEGAGSYGTVYRVKVNGVPRVAKQLHEALVNPDVSVEEREKMFQGFYRECDLLSKLYHPNVVEFIGVHFKGDKISLIMERLYTDLYRFIDKEKHPSIPFSVKTSILLDVSFGLSYLHSMKPEPIIHRDLTAQNILLTRDLRAKIADLGVAKLLSTESKSRSQTKCPGAQAYMPPEALKDKPSYGTELDVFSFGHLTLCVAVQECIWRMRAPPECDYEIIADHCRQNHWEVLIRKSWLDSLKNPDALLRELIVSCLNDKSEKRPSAKKVSDVMKIHCDKFPKTPDDIAAVWDSELEGTEVSCNIKTIQTLQKQLDEISSEKEVLEKENASLKDTVSQLKKSHINVGQEISDLTKELCDAKKMLQDYQESLHKEQRHHKCTKEAKKEKDETALRMIQFLNSQLQQITRERDGLRQKLLETGSAFQVTSGVSGTSPGKGRDFTQSH